MLRELFKLFESQGMAIDDQRNDVFDGHSLNELNYNALKAIKQQLVDIEDVFSTMDTEVVTDELNHVIEEIDDYFEE